MNTCSSYALVQYDVVCIDAQFDDVRTYVNRLRGNTAVCRHELPKVFRLNLQLYIYR